MKTSVNTNGKYQLKIKSCSSCGEDHTVEADHAPVQAPEWDYIFMCPSTKDIVFAREIGETMTIYESQGNEA